MPTLGEMMDLSEAQDFSTIPEGVYHVAVDSVKDPAPTKKGDKLLMKFTLRVIAGEGGTEHEGRKIFDQVIVKGAGVGFAVNFLNAVLKADYSPRDIGEIAFENGWSDLVDQELMVRCYHDEYNGQTSVKVRQYMPYMAG